MTDPRIAKLPAWARDHIEALHLRAALAWPSEPKPEPWFDLNDSIGQLPPDDARNSVAWWVNVYDGSVLVEPIYIALHGLSYRSPERRGIGSRPHGPHYRTDRDALLAGQWLLAERAAKALRDVAKRIEAIP